MRRAWLAMLALASAPAAAQPAPAPDTAEAQAKAKAKWDEGKRYFDLADYAKAIALWKDAYVLYAAPTFLFNIGQAYRLSGNCPEALRLYANYERVAGELASRDREELEEAKGRCKDAANPTPNPTPNPNPNPNPTPTPNPNPTPTPNATPNVAPAPTNEHPLGDELHLGPAPKRDDHSAMRLAGIGVGVGGVVLGGLGGYLAWRASEDAHTVSNFRGEWTQQQRDVDQSGQAAATWSTITIVAGAASIATGAVLYYLGSRTTESHVGVAVTPSGARVGWSVAF